MRIRIGLFMVLVILLVTSCKSDYDKLVRTEMKSGLIEEDLIFGLKLGQEKKEFYNICWQLNSQKLVSQGPSNEMVRYLIQPEEIEGETQEIEMLFYGSFDEEKIMRGLKMKLSYVSWAPWNEELHSPELAKNIRPYFMKLYGGNDFIEVDLVKDYKTYVKVDGNRQIVIFPQTTKDVMVKIDDLRYKLSDDS